MHPDKYTLTWHSHSDYLREMMREMMTSDDFTDVTLVTDDKKTIRAHRNILSACSPVFKNILQMENNKSHPVIYLRGIQQSEIESILQFIYLGEAKFDEERLVEFLSVSKNLEIRELSKGIEITDTVNVDHNNITQEKEGSTNISESTNDEIIGIEIKSVGPKFQCPTCNKLFSHKCDVQRHIRSVHEGFHYACNQCDLQYTQQSSLLQHIRSVHEGVRYACSQCDYQTAKQGNLTTHIESQHEGVKFACNQCEHKTTKQGCMTQHIRSVHLGVKYACNQCDYKATKPGNLTMHIKSQHEGVKHACNQCDYQTSQQSHLKRHQRKHL